MTNSSFEQPTPDHTHDQPQKKPDVNASDAHSASWPEIVLHQPEQTTGQEDVPLDVNDIKAVVAAAERHEDVRFKAVEVVFMSAEEITEVNRTYLDHDYVTDIITFRLDDEEDLYALEGTLCCCDERIREQSRELGVGEREEFLRVLIHGILHLCGWDDKTAEQEASMRKREDEYLERLG